VVLEVAAGENWDALVARTVASGWSGLECLSGIPGLVGASPIQNVGAYGQEVCSSIEQVRTWDRSLGEICTLSKAECGFGYRTSRFKTEPDRFVVLSVTLALDVRPTSEPIRYPELAQVLGVALQTQVPLTQARATVLGLRASKGMVLDPTDHDTWSAGSFFTNPILDLASYEALRARAVQHLGPDGIPPRFAFGDGLVKTPAAWLVERAGFGRGYGSDRVRVSFKHTLALTNRGGATTAELLALAEKIRAGVAETFGVELTLEPVVVGT
jgi:UDP-N-acetylmuramate dehydrogenase